MSKLYPKLFTSFKEDVARHYFEAMGVEKGIYGMRNQENGLIEYVGEAVDMSYRIWQHFHDFRFGGNLNLFHNSFFRKLNPDLYRPVTREESVPYVERLRELYQPEVLYAQTGDTAEDNGERLKQEVLLMDKYKDTIINDDRLDLRYRNHMNKWTNEFGRYE